MRAVQELCELRERAPLQHPAILRTALGDARERAERIRRHQSFERPLGAARVAHPVGERGRSRRGRTGPRDLLALGAAHAHSAFGATSFCAQRMGLRDSLHHGHIVSQNLSKVGRGGAPSRTAA